MTAGARRHAGVHGARADARRSRRRALRSVRVLRGRVGMPATASGRSAARRSPRSQLAIETHELEPCGAAVPERVRAVLERGLATEPSRSLRRHACAARGARARRRAAHHAQRDRRRDRPRSCSRRRNVLGQRERSREPPAPRACDAAAGAMRARFGVAASMRDVGERAARDRLAVRAERGRSHDAACSIASTSLLADEAGSVCRDTTLSAHAACAARTACLERARTDVDIGRRPARARQRHSRAKARPKRHGRSTIRRRAAEGPSTARARCRSAFASASATIRALIGRAATQSALAAATQLLADARARHDKRRRGRRSRWSLGGLQDEIDHPKRRRRRISAAEAAAEEQGRDLDAAGALGRARRRRRKERDGLRTGAPRPRPRARQARTRRRQPGDRIQAVDGRGAGAGYENRVGEAERAMRGSLELATQLYGADLRTSAEGYGTLSQIVDGEGKHAEQLVDAQKSLDIITAAYGERHPMVAIATGNLAVAFKAVDRLDDARRTLLAADKLFTGLYGPNHPTRAAVFANLGNIEMRANNWAAARDDLEQAKALWVKIAGPMSAAVAGNDRDLGDVYQSLGRSTTRSRAIRRP